MMAVFRFRGKEMLHLKKFTANDGVISSPREINATVKRKKIYNNLPLRQKIVFKPIEVH